MIPSLPGRSRASALAALVPALLALLAGAPLAAQEEVRLFAGDSVRVDGRIVGRILSVDGSNLVVISREAPRCRAGQAHGEAPVCDPAPLVRHTLDLNEVVIEERREAPHLMLRTIGGGILGAAAFGTAGYFFGPSIGFGRVDGCLVTDSNIDCATGETRYTADELAARQKRSDQRKGAFFFGVIGGSATAVLVNKLSVGWVRVQPVVSVDSASPWGLNVSVPAPR